MRNQLEGDRLKEYRHTICIDVNVIAPKSSFWAVANNISGGGLEIQCPSTLSPKTNLMISMQLQEEFVFHGTVVWTLGDFVDNRWIYRAGIKTDVIAFRNTSITSAKDKAELILRILPQIKAKGSEIGFLKKMSA